LNKLVRTITAGGLFLLAVLVLPAVAFGQPLPTPGAFVRNLDVRCYKIANPPPGVTLQLDHLNPVLLGMGLPPETVTLNDAQELCVPVYKNGIPPPANVAPFIRFVDWKCYGITGPSLNLPLNLNQLNNEIVNTLGPTVNVIVREPQQLCVPVFKNNSPPPPAVAQLVRWLDVKCYRVESTQNPADKQIRLHHLNPLITQPVETVTFLPPPNPSQLCVPVKKNLVAPPAAILNIVRWADVLCYRINAAPLNMTFTLTHLNPVLQSMGLAPEVNVPVTTATELCVPVAKNGVFPPG
jgi:hypothetical protein